MKQALRQSAPLIASVFVQLLIAPNAAQATEPLFTLNNPTSFYLNNQPRNLNCGPAQIAPGASKVPVNDYWCGYVACATKDYDADPSKGCLEVVDKKMPATKQPGGYATWFSISYGTATCTVPTGNTYACQWNSSTHDFSLDYLSVVQKYSAGPSQGKEVTLPKVSVYSTGPAFRGVNISGLEYDGTFLDALFQHPDLPDARYFAEQGMNIVRLPVRWEFLLSQSKTALADSTEPTSRTLNAMYLKAVYDTAQKLLSAGLSVDLDLHNYMRFCPTGAAYGQTNEPTDPVGNACQLVRADQLAYIWGILAREFAPLAKQYPKQLLFGLMNEPFWDAHEGQQLHSDDLLRAQAAAVQAIRNQGLSNLILLSGNYWDPLHAWTTLVPEGAADVPNGTAFTAANLRAAGITGDVALEMHQYFDKDFSGRSENCVSYTSYPDFKQKLGLDALSAWIKTNQIKTFLGEFGAANNGGCKQDLGYMLQFVNENAYDASHPEKGGFIGWTAWRANRHGNAGFSLFNFLQAEDGTVYGATGKPVAGTGIVQGAGNGLMNDLFAQFLTKP